MTHLPDPETLCGSSPLARGLRKIIDANNQDVRIIPARAGFTATSSTAYGPPEDHPRSRGVYPGTIFGITRSRGSSPLARGLP